MIGPQGVAIMGVLPQFNEDGPLPPGDFSLGLAELAEGIIRVVA